MSVPSWKVTTTCDNPNLEMDRTISRPGSPLIACSTGKVICRSTSSGASEGATVLTWIWTGVVSGKASMSKCASDTAPMTASASEAPMTRKRCRNEKSMTQLSTQISLYKAATGARAPQGDRCLRPVGRPPVAALFGAATFAEVVLQEFRPEHVAARGRHNLPWQNARNDLREVPVSDPEP